MSAPDGEYPKTVVLKDGAHVGLRVMAAADREGVSRLAAGAAPEDGRLSPDAAEVVVVAEDGGRVVGAATLARDGEAGAVAIVLDPAYRGRRLGTWMLLDAVHLASARGMTRLEARAHPDDQDLIAALRRLDFVIDGARSLPARLLLAKTLHAAWPDF